MTESPKKRKKTKAQLAALRAANVAAREHATLVKPGAAGSLPTMLPEGLDLIRELSARATSLKSIAERLGLPWSVFERMRAADHRITDFWEYGRGEIETRLRQRLMDRALDMESKSDVLLIFASKVLGGMVEPKAGPEVVVNNSIENRPTAVLLVPADAKSPEDWASFVEANRIEPPPVDELYHQPLLTSKETTND